MVRMDPGRVVMLRLVHYYLAVVVAAAVVLVVMMLEIVENGIAVATMVYYFQVKLTVFVAVDFFVDDDAYYLLSLACYSEVAKASTLQMTALTLSLLFQQRMRSKMIPLSLRLHCC